MMEERRHPDGDARTRFLETISHDLRTPLTALRGALGLLERQDVPPEMTQQMVSLLRRASDRLERLAFALITIDLIDNGSLSTLREVVDLREIVEDATRVTRREHPSIALDLPPEPVTVTCDRERLEQTLDHLLDNARKFGGADGTIRVEVRSDETHATVRVSDEGPGIDPADRERVFERYVQIGERLPNEPRGAGIGLYLARWSVEAVGGSIEIGEGGPGATFEIRLPRFVPDRPR